MPTINNVIRNGIEYSLNKVIHNGIEYSFGRSGGGAYLDAISDLTATSGPMQISLTWTDPDDVVVSGYTFTKWKCTKLVRKVGSIPTDVNDGTLVATFTVRNGHTLTPYVDTGVESNITYYYVAFAISDGDEVTDGNSSSATPYRSRTFTMTYEETSSPVLSPIYSDDATGMSVESTDFDEFFGYYGCRLNTSGQETAVVTQAQSGGNGKLDITRLGNLTSGDNVMIAFPRRGIKMSKSGSTVTISVTDDPNKEGYQYYAFTRNGTIMDRLYIGVYKATKSSNILKSWSGTSAIGSMSLDNITTYAKANNPLYDPSNSNYDEITWYIRNYINALYILKYCNLNSQSKIGMGYVGGSAAQQTGATNSITNATGATSTSKTGRIKLFGLEDWWGNVWERLDGAYYSSATNLQVSKTQAFALTGKITSYDTNITVASGWMSSAVATNEGMFASNGTSGSSSTYYCDNFRTASNRGLRSSGGWSNGANAGAFFVYDANVSTGDSNYGGRLIYL